MRRTLRFVVAYDKFKDSLNATQLCEVTSKALAKAATNVTVQTTSIPLADGGDGFLECIEHFFRQSEQEPSRQHIWKDYTMDRIHMRATGPLGSHVNGTGELILDAYERGARELYLGVGGSATVDFGIGALHALGLSVHWGPNRRFSRGCILCGNELKDITDIEFSENKKLLPGLRLHIVSDVNSPLLGPKGAVYMFARQKGAKEEDLPILEQRMAKMAALVRRKSEGRIVLDDMPKMGAAGGIVGGLYSCLDCQVHSGIQFVAEMLGLEEQIKAADAVITGEGAFDEQTLEGKTVSHVLKLAQKHHKKATIICGLNRLSPAATAQLGLPVFDLVSRCDLSGVYSLALLLESFHSFDVSSHRVLL